MIVLVLAFASEATYLSVWFFSTHMRTTAYSKICVLKNFFSQYLFLSIRCGTMVSPDWQCWVHPILVKEWHSLHATQMQGRECCIAVTCLLLVHCLLKVELYPKNFTVSQNLPYIHVYEANLKKYITKLRDFLAAILSQAGISGEFVLFVAELSFLLAPFFDLSSVLVLLVSPTSCFDHFSLNRLQVFWL